MPHNLKAVTSSQIHAISHDPESKTLRIQFHGKDQKPGATYEYAQFPAEKFAAFEKAESIGKHFGKEIRGKYPTKKLED